MNTDSSVAPPEASWVAAIYASQDDPAPLGTAAPSARGARSPLTRSPADDPH